MCRLFSRKYSKKTSGANTFFPFSPCLQQKRDERKIPKKKKKKKKKKEPKEQNNLTNRATERELNAVREFISALIDSNLIQRWPSLVRLNE